MYNYLKWNTNRMPFKVHSQKLQWFILKEIPPIWRHLQNPLKEVHCLVVRKHFEVFGKLKLAWFKIRAATLTDG